VAHESLAKDRKFGVYRQQPIFVVSSFIEMSGTNDIELVMDKASSPPSGVCFIFLKRTMCGIKWHIINSRCASHVRIIYNFQLTLSSLS